MLNIRAAAACQVKRRRRRISMHEYRHILIACRLPSKEAAAYLTPHASVKSGVRVDVPPLILYILVLSNFKKKNYNIQK